MTQKDQEQKVREPTISTTNKYAQQNITEQVRGTIPPPPPKNRRNKEKLNNKGKDRYSHAQIDEKKHVMNMMKG